MTTTSTATLCGICGAPCGQDAYLCSEDITVLTASIKHTPDALTDLRTTIARQDVIGGGGEPHRTGKPTPPIPVNLSAMEIEAELLAAIRAALHDHHTTAEPRTIAHRIATRPDAADTATRLTRAVRTARRMVDRRPAEWFFGHCTACATPLLAAPDTARVICRECGHGHDGLVLRTRQWQAAEDMLVTAVEAAQWIAVRWDLADREPVRKAINSWVHRRTLDSRAGRVRFGDVDHLWRRRMDMRRRKAELAAERRNS